MKNTRKILVALLAMTLLFSAFAVSVFADDSAVTASEETSQKYYEEVLEYFEAGYYLNESFDVTSGDEAFLDSTSEFDAQFNASNYKPAEEGWASFASTSPAYFDIIPEEVGSFGINLRARLDKGTFMSKPNLALVLHSSIRNDKTDTLLKLFEVKENSISIYDSESGIAVEVSNNLPILTDFDLEFFYESMGSYGVATLKITSLDKTDAGEPVFAFEESYDVSKDGFTINAIDLRNARVIFDYAEIYKGSFPRRLAGNEVTIGKLINELVAEYNDPAIDAEVGFNCLEIAAKVLLTHNFDIDVITDRDLHESVVKSGNTAIEVVGNEYIKEYFIAAESIDVAADYNTSLDLVNSLDIYVDFLTKAEKSDVYTVEFNKTFAEINAIHDVIAAEVKRLDTLKAQTIASLEAVSKIPDIYLANYSDLRTAYEVIMNNPICDTYYDDEISLDYVIATSKSADIIVAEYEKLNAKAENFVENVAVATNEENSFADRYAAYLIAKANYFADASYNAFITDNTVEALVAAYDSINKTMTDISAYAEAFIAKVDEANLTLSYSVRNAALDVAATYLEDVEKGYPGVVDSIALYDSLRLGNEAKIVSTENYINAVLAIQGLTSISDKKAAIANAKTLAADGSDVSVDVTVDGISVKEANIILSNEESAIILAETRVINFIAAVNAISGKTDMIDKRSAINYAVSLEANVDASASGVAAASASLKAEIEAYNADVANANNSSAEALDCALSVLSGTIPTDRIAEVVAILKKIYD